MCDHPISYEHTDILGKRLAAIAGEKAGIIKTGSVVVSSHRPMKQNAVIDTTCRKLEAKLIRVGKDITFQRTRFDDLRQSLIVHGRLRDYEFTIPLLGQYQLSNAAAASAL